MNKKGKKSEKKAKKKASKWKQQSLQFREAMKAMRHGKPAPTIEDTSLKKCKFCNRKFNEKAAERHIPFCEKKFKENQIKLGVKGKK